MFLMLKCQKDENGFAVIWVLSFTLLVLFIGICFFELSSVYVERGKLINAADAAAAAGATAIDEDVLIATGNVVLDPAEAKARCEDSLLKTKDEEASTIVVTPNSCQTSADTTIVEAEAEVSFSVLFSMLGIDSHTISVSSEARPSCSDDLSAEGAC